VNGQTAFYIKQNATPVQIDSTNTILPICWSGTGFFSGGLNPSSSAPPVLYATTPNDEIGQNIRAWKSTDGGNTWAQLDAANSTFVDQDFNQGYFDQSGSQLGICWQGNPMGGAWRWLGRFDFSSEKWEVLETTFNAFLFWGIDGSIASVALHSLPLLPNAQLIFQGVRRQQGSLPQLVPGVCFHRKSFTIEQQIVINSTGTFPAELQAAAPQTLVQPVYDYDFEWHELRITYQSAGTVPKVVCAVYLYDAVKNQLSNLPVLDHYYNGAPPTKYENWAQVPPLVFPLNS
jgi:hypothetical protein